MSGESIKKDIDPAIRNLWDEDGIASYHRRIQGAVAVAGAQLADPEPIVDPELPKKPLGWD